MNPQEERSYHSITKTVLLLCIAAAAILFLVTRAFGQTERKPVAYLPSVSQRCGNPCAHSIPYPTPTATPFINEPPVPTEAK